MAAITLIWQRFITIVRRCSAIKKLTLGALLVALLIIGSNELAGNSKSISPNPVMDSTQTVYVHLFEWTWADIAQECEVFLGPQGYNAVQISPPQEHAVLAGKGYPWWQRYQPVSYTLKSRSGDRAELVDMVSRCHAAGVQVYADAVINHMSGELSGVGSAGTRFTKYNYPKLYSSDDFHACRSNIKDYGKHQEVTSCELSGLPDLNTGSVSVRHRIAGYLADLLSVGIDGFRIDAAKHIQADELQAILAELDTQTEQTPYVYQEVIDPGHEAVKKSEYYANGDVIEFEYGRRVGEKFLGLEGQTLAQLQTLGEAWGLAPSDKALVFIDNHDKQRGHGGGGTYLTYKDGALYDLANIFMLAFPYGYPQVMSSYEFSDTDQGPPADVNGKTQAVFQNGQTTCFDRWKCEHRRPMIANMVTFRNYAASEFRLTDWWSNGANQIAFGRGDRGFVVINRDNQPMTQMFQTQMAPGQYCNLMHAEHRATGFACSSDAVITVNKNHQLTLTLPPMSAAAIYGGSQEHF